jgi:hypothetical protein
MTRNPERALAGVPAVRPSYGSPTIRPKLSVMPLRASRVSRQVKLKPGIWPLIELSICCPEAFPACSSGSFGESSVLLGGPAPTARIAEARRLR